MDQKAREIITEPRTEVFVSAASAWEIAIKSSLGKLPCPPDVERWLPEALELQRFRPLPITVRHACMVEGLPPYHSDPFDRLLVAQAIVEDLQIVTADRKLARYDVRVLLF